MKEEWLMSGAVIPVDVETTAALVMEIKRLIDVIGGLVLKQGPDYERGFVDGGQKQMQSSVDKAVNAMAQPEQEPDVVMHWTSGTWTINNPPPKGCDDVNLYYAPPQPEQKLVQRDCKHEWADDTKDKPQWRCINCGENYMGAA